MYPRPPRRTSASPRSPSGSGRSSGRRKAARPGHRPLDRLFDRKNERDAVEAFYTGRFFAPLWIDNGAANARAKAVLAQLAAADADGLDPADYPRPDFKAGAEPDALADAELKLTVSVLTYARHAQTGRVHFSRIGADIAYTQCFPSPPISWPRWPTPRTPVRRSRATIRRTTATRR